MPPPSFFSSVVAFGANEKMESGKPPPGAKKRGIYIGSMGGRGRSAGWSVTAVRHSWIELTDIDRTWGGKGKRRKRKEVPRKQAETKIACCSTSAHGT